MHTYGLLSGAFRPDGDIRRLRSYLRQRAMLVEYASQHIQHMQKALTQMNVKLHHVISDITGKTGMDIIAGHRGRRAGSAASWRNCAIIRIKADEATIAKSLQGHWREEHIFELTQALELYRFYQDKITECDREIEAQLERFEDRSDGEPSVPNGKKRNQKNAPRFDVQGQLYRMTGVDLTRIDGVDAYTALKVISEIGTDMTKWPSAKHFVSWLGLSPEQPYHRRQGHQLKGQAQRQPGGGSIASGRQRTAPLRQRPGGVPAPEEGPSGSAQGHHRHRPQAGQAHLHHAALWPGIRGCWRGTLRDDDITSERCVPPSVGRPNWATSWFPCPMPGTAPRTHLPARQSPRDNVG